MFRVWTKNHDGWERDIECRTFVVCFDRALTLASEGNYRYNVETRVTYRDKPFVTIGQEAAKLFCRDSED